MVSRSFSRKASANSNSEPNELVGNKEDTVFPFYNY